MTDFSTFPGNDKGKFPSKRHQYWVKIEYPTFYSWWAGVLLIFEPFSQQQLGHRSLDGKSSYPLTSNQVRA